MAKVLGSALLSFANVAGRNKIRDDDVIDQLNHWATVGFLMTLAAGTGAKQFVGAPIRCWLPAEYKKKWYLMYANNYCWLNDMYYIPFSDQIPFEEEDRYGVDISFYRWVTVMFLLQALLFKLPNLFWKELKGYSGLNVAKVIALIQGTSMLTLEEREVKLFNAASFMHRWLQTYSQYQFNAIARFREKFSSVFFCFGKRTGTYLTGLYLFIKMMYVANSIGQFFLLSTFLDLNYWSFGWDAMSTLRKTGRWQDHYTFPRIGLCDYKIRQMANVQTFSVQCVLSINLFLEKMYLLLWFWLIAMMVANIANLVMWIVDDVVPSRSQNMMLRYAKMMGLESQHDTTLFRLFAFNHMRRDGVFILRMVAKNTSDVLALDLVRQLYKCFLTDLDKRDRRRNGAAPRTLPRQPSAPADEGEEGDDDDGDDFVDSEPSTPEKPPLN